MCSAGCNHHITLASPRGSTIVFNPFGSHKIALVFCFQNPWERKLNSTCNLKFNSRSTDTMRLTEDYRNGRPVVLTVPCHLAAVIYI